MCLQKLREGERARKRELTMLVSILLSFSFPASTSLFITALSVINLTSSAYIGFSEVRGKHLLYSKFWNAISSESGRRKGEQITLSSRTGMLFLYTPTFLVGLASFVLFPLQDLRILLLVSAITLHFFKRVLEVLFVHKYSGRMVLDSVIVISSGYFVSFASMIYAQHLTQGSSEPPVDLKYPGILLFLVGISGNFYHHFLLSKLRREEGDKEYRIPKGGLFNLVICPHYLFEIIDLLGISFISQTLYAFCLTLGSVFYLIARSYATGRWYLSKFEDFPEDVKALIPYVF
ncbi:3-oxo-5-alpha-steroid 4-dehydrogenase 2-like [Juglans microcarpa x Juglans regia]|uniref:3-oxo-5-alpha-steroid 4-dehydrogenase 2-like n=1 Tax=Juglans microcarpa x Juglans regia TaxID=2249226 RepID=UPI001B7E074A|nr:3-oxo-5-alpha-steroid 4-dehydrogenase 2-like [Juglans microcarpa x Juglans regia]